MNKLRWLPALVVLILLLLVVTAPARLLGQLVPAQALLLSGFGGSVWSGRAAAAAVPLTGGVLQLGELEWRLRPWSLLLLSPRAQITSRWGQQRVEAQVSVSPGGTITLSEATISIPAEIARHWFPVLLSGNVTLQTERLVLEDLRPTAGAGRLVWQQAGWSADGSSNRLGDYALEFEVVAPGEVAGNIITLAGPVEVVGTANLYPDRYTVDARLGSDGGLSPGLSNALRLFATPTDSGFHIKLDTPLQQ
jgi:general secretion pathway protein N